MTEYSTQPEGDIFITEQVTMDSLTNGQIRILSKACGCRFQDIREYMSWNEDDLMGVDEDGDAVCLRLGRGRYDGPVDEADLVWGLGKIALLRAGFEGTDDEADRVSFDFSEAADADPTEAA